VGAGAAARRRAAPPAVESHAIEPLIIEPENANRMHLIRRLDAWPADRPADDPAGTVATIGNFDGVHVGHRVMLKAVRQRADALGLPATVVSFEPLPHEFFAGADAPGRLQGLRERLASLEACRMDRLLLLPFDTALAAQEAEAFVRETLVGALGARHVVIGDDFRFGRGRAGDLALLERMGPALGFTVTACPTVERDGERASSSRIRIHLEAGELDAAARLLGRPYRIGGRVVHGEKVGRTLGFPTANVALGRHRPPLRGVFAVQATDLERGETWPGVANLGERPTVGGRRLLLEVHALDRAPELYGHHLAVDFLHRIRAEQRFDSLDALKAQIADDANAAREWLAAAT